MPVTEPPRGRFRTVGTHELLADIAGTGGPTVVFLAGAGAVGLDYWMAHAQVAAFTTSVVYDRAGTGWSDRAVNPVRTAASAADELFALLTGASVPAPYVLVGHSLGADYARVFAARFPHLVAGLVLVDPHHEDLTAFMPPELAAANDSFDPDQVLQGEPPAEFMEQYRSLFEQEMAAWPDEIRTPLIACHLSREWLRTGLVEAMGARTLTEELRAAAWLPHTPLIVLTAAGVDPFRRLLPGAIPEALLLGEIEGKSRLYDRIAAGVPHGENRRIEGVGHTTLAMRRPDTITRAVRDVVGARTSSPVDVTRR